MCKFVFKGESDILPSKVAKAEVYRSPFQLSRSSRNLQKCGYSCKKVAYTHPGEGYNPFDMYALQNIGTLERFVDICCSHVRSCGCKGKIVFISPRLNDIPTSFRGTLFSIHTAQCSECGVQFQLESDYFEVKPNKNEKVTCFSRVSQLAGIASKNMSFVFSEINMLFACLGLVFFSVRNFQWLRDYQGGVIIKLTEEVVAANLDREIEMVKNGKGLPQGIQKFRKPEYTREQVNSMRSDELKRVLEEIGFPSLSKKEERLEAVNLLLFESDEEQKRLFEEKYGNRIFWRLDVGGDGSSWAFRSYNNNVKSAYGQAALIGACTKSVVAWGHRILKCYTCSRAENSRSIAKEHDCQINHRGSVKAMESEIILECFQKLCEKQCVVSQIALDGDSTTLSLLQKTLINEVAFRRYGGEVIVDMKAVDRHLNKTIKDRVYNAMNANTRIRKGQPKAKPLKEPQDCYKLGRFPSLIRAQLQADTSIPFSVQVHLFQERLLNGLKHYFNDDNGKHASCVQCGFVECEVVQAQVHNSLAAFWRVAFVKGIRLETKIMKVIAGFVNYFGTNSSMNIGSIIDMKLVKPKLADGLWLGERCVDEEQLAGFRRDMESIYTELASLKTAKKNNAYKQHPKKRGPTWVPVTYLSQGHQSWKQHRVCICYGSWCAEAFFGRVLCPNSSSKTWLHTSSSSFTIPRQEPCKIEHTWCVQNLSKWEKNTSKR